MTVDFSDSFGEHAAERLDSEQVLWLTTTSPTGQPSPNPVWFLRRDDHVLIASDSGAAKVRAIASNPKVALSFNSTPDGGDVVVLNGIASLRDGHLSGADLNAYLAKYAEGIARIGLTTDSFARDYDQLIDIELVKLRGFVG